MLNTRCVTQETIQKMQLIHNLSCTSGNYCSKSEKKSPALSGTVDCNRYPVVISKKRYSLLCKHSETAKVVKEEHVSFESTRQYDHPLPGDTTYAEKLWPVTINITTVVP